MKRNLLIILIATFLSAFAPAANAEPLLGEIRMFAGNFAPRHWAFCEGQFMSIRDNTALFSILGTTYGGDGRTTFRLPDLRNRTAVHPGDRDSGGAKLGRKKTGQQVIRSNGDESDPTTQSTLRIHYIICIKGTFPSRS